MFVMRENRKRSGRRYRSDAMVFVREISPVFKPMHAVLCDAVLFVQTRAVGVQIDAFCQLCLGSIKVVKKVDNVKITTDALFWVFQFYTPQTKIFDGGTKRSTSLFESLFNE